jgi:hypothetical protein
MASSKLTTRRATPRKPIVCHSKDKYKPVFHWTTDLVIVDETELPQLHLFACRPEIDQLPSIQIHSGPYRLETTPIAEHCTPFPVHMQNLVPQGTYQLRAKAIWPDGVVAFTWITVIVTHVE